MSWNAPGVTYTKYSVMALVVDADRDADREGDEDGIPDASKEGTKV